MADLNLGQLATHTGRARSRVLQDQVSDYRPFTAAMKENGGIARKSGGRNVVEEFAHAQNDTANWIGENEEISLTQTAVSDAASFEWFHAGGSFTISGPEKRMNSGGDKTKYIDIVSTKMMVLEESMANIYHSGVLSAGTGVSGKQVDGMLALVSKTPNSGTVGGIDTSATAAAFYRNFDFDTSADWSDGSVDAGNVKRFLSKLINNTVAGSNKQFGICGDTHYEFLEQALQAHQRVSSGDSNIGSQHDHLMYRGRKFYFGGGVNYSGESQLQDDLTYLVTPGKGKLQIVFHKDAEFSFLEPVNARNQDAVTRLMILMLTMCVNARKLQAVGYDS